MLFAMKCDGQLDNVPWMAVWTPMWIYNAITLFAAFFLFTVDTTEKTSRQTEKKRDEERGGEAHDEDDEHDANDMGVVVKFHEKVLNFVGTVLFLLIQLFVLLRMDDLGAIGSWNWFAVFVPWFLYEALNFFSLIPSAVKVIATPDHDSVHEALGVSGGGDADSEDAEMKHYALEAKYFEEVMNQQSDRMSMVASLFRVWFAIFLAMQLNGSVDWNWGLVFLPLWIYLALEIAVHWRYRSQGKAALANVDLEQLLRSNTVDYVTMAKIQQAQQMVSHASTNLMLLAIPVFVLIMLVCRLQGGDYSTFLIILPVFIILGCTCLCVFCGLICLANVDTDKLKEEIEARSGGGGHHSSGPTGDVESGAAAEEYSPPEVPETSSSSAPAAEKSSAAYGTFSKGDSAAKETASVAANVLHSKDVSIDID